MEERQDQGRPEEKAPQEELREFLNQLLGLLPQGARVFFEQYSREIISGVLAVVIAVIVYSGYTTYSESQEREAATRLGTALYIKDPGQRLEAFEKVIKEHGSTDAADLALALAARAQYDLGNKAKAKEYFEKAQKSASKKSVVYGTSVLGQGYVLEETGHPKEAMEMFEKATHAGSGFEKVALLDKARAAKEAGDKEAALDALNRYLNENPTSKDLDFVKFQILNLKRKGG